MTMHGIERLRDNYEYPAARRVAFEDMCTLIFCEYLQLPGAVNMRPNQKGVEADPVEAVDPQAGDRRRFAYQVKYFDEGTELRARASEFRDSIDAARELGADVLMLFVNKDLLDTDKEKAFEGGLDAYAKKEAFAEDGAKLSTVRLDWWTLSKIEMALALPRYSHIPDRFLGSNVGSFYRAVRELFYSDEGENVYGRVPLSECYIEPTVDVRGEGGDWLTTREWIESFVDGDETVAMLCGEPGHGKTSLCRKAVADFYKAGWLARRVSNVFCFSLNPANTDALANGQLNLYSLLSWGGDRTDPDHKIKAEQCRGALVLLDAFDELLEWKPGLNLRVFIQEHISRFQKETKSRVVITTRSMVVEPGVGSLQIGRSFCVPVVRLRPITREQQLGWIARYAELLRGQLAQDPWRSSRDGRTGLEDDLAQLETYAKCYAELDENADFQKILGIPIIFRMVVAARYLPREGESITRIYDDLFEATWERHAHRDADPSTDPLEETKRQLMRHALRVFADDADTAAVGGILESSWLFSFYTTHQERMRVGFLHRSFYQHFLAREVVSWFERYAGGEDDETTFRHNLSYLARRRLDETTLRYIKDSHGGIEDKGSLSPAFDKAYKVLKETDGILPLTSDEHDAAQIETVAPLERANNVFWNVISVCSICGQKVTTDKVGALALQSYQLDGCHMEDADLEGAELEEAELEGAELEGAYLAGAELVWADLRGADLAGANLAGADLTKVRIVKRTDLEQAQIEGANLEGVVFEED